MALITIVLEDTPVGGVAIHSSYKPAVGRPLTPAQSAALEMINRTTRDWGLPPKKVDSTTVQPVTDWAAA